MKKRSGVGRGGKHVLSDSESSKHSSGDESPSSSSDSNGDIAHNNSVTNVPEPSENPNNIAGNNEVSEASDDSGSDSDKEPVKNQTNKLEKESDSDSD